MAKEESDESAAWHLRNRAWRTWINAAAAAGENKSITENKREADRSVIAAGLGGTGDKQAGRNNGESERYINN